MSAYTFQDVLEGVEGAARIIACLLTPMLRSRRAHWGATPEEVALSLPGDEYVPHPRWAYTHAVSIDAPADEVWRWLVQFGYGRGGLYSYQWLESVVGCDMHNAERIIPELQTLKVGDGIKIDSRIPAIPVAQVDFGHTIVLHGTPSAEVSNNYLWSFHVRPIDATHTRLIVRSRSDYPLTFANRLAWGPALMEPIGFVMERKMMLGIKRRAEANRQSQPAYA